MAEFAGMNAGDAIEVCASVDFEAAAPARAIDFANQVRVVSAGIR